MPKRPPMEIEFVASPRADAEEKHKALLALLARGVVESNSCDRPAKGNPPIGSGTR